MEKQHKERKVSYKYSFRLDEQQNIRFCRMLAEAGLEHNRSRFIVKRIFAEEFRVVRIDPTLGRYVTRLNQFYEQIQRGMSVHIKWFAKWNYCLIIRWEPINMSN